MIQWQAGKPFAKNQAALFKRLNGLTWGPNNPMQGVFAGQQFMQADMNFSIMFPEGWQTLNTPRFRRGIRAESEGNRVIRQSASDRDRPMNWQKHLPMNSGLRRSLNQRKCAHSRSVSGPRTLFVSKTRSGVEPVSIYNVWVNSRSSTFQIVAVGRGSLSR